MPGSVKGELRLKERLKNRRRMAWISFVLVVFAGGGMVAYGLTSDAVAGRVGTMAGPVGIILGVWVSIILAYMGSCSYEHTKGNGK